MPLGALILAAGCGGGSDEEDGELVGTATPAACDAYCKQFAPTGSACGAPNLQYGTPDQCTNLCLAFPAGKDGDTRVNSLACRVTHAQKSAMSPATECVYAGPSVNGGCGDVVESFCSLATAICHAEYPTMEGCKTVATGIQPGPLYAFGAPGISSGNTLSCRLFYVANAAQHKNEPEARSADCALAGIISMACK